MLRIIAALMFTFAGAMYGVSRSLGLRTRVKRSEEIVSMLERIAVIIRTTGSDVYSICRILASDSSFTELRFRDRLPAQHDITEDFHVIWQNAVSSQTDLTADECELLSELGRCIGTSDCEGQLKVLSALTEKARGIHAAASEAYTSKGRLYRSVGTLFGAMAGIIII